MSRRSQAFAEGQQKFSWRLERVVGDDGRERVKCACRNHPTVIGWGNDEQTAMRAAQKAIESAAEQADLGTSQLTRGEELKPIG